MRDHLNSTNTARLLEKASQGDEDAFARLFAAHRKSLHRFVDMRLDQKLRPRVDVDDVVQETEVEAFRRLEDYMLRKPMPFHLWLRKTAQERLIAVRRQHLGAAQRTLEREVPLPDRSSLILAGQVLAQGPSASQQVAQHEIARRVRVALAKLSEVDREILAMRNFDGLDNQEIGLLLEIEPGTVSKRHGRALLRLHKLLLQGGITESEL